MKKGFSYILLSFVFWSAYSQEIKFDQPSRLSDEVNSSAEDLNALLSPDGQKLFFVRVFSEENNGGKIAGSDIWSTEKDDHGNWKKASNKTYPWNSKASDALIGINKNNTIVYLLNSYKNKNGIAFSKLINSKWTTPEIIPVPGLEKSEFVGFYMNPAFNILLISMNNKDSFGEEDLYVSFKDSLDHWSAPLNLGTTINTSGFEISPFLSEDNKKLYFSSNGHAGLGDADIFVAERLYESWTVWSKPKNLGTPINSDKFDSYFSVYGDTLCYFSSNRASSFSDIYKASIRKKTNLKDSINRIIQETQQLLSGLKSTDGSEIKEKTEFIPFDLNSSSITSSIKEQINAFIKNINPTAIKSIEVNGYAGDSSNPSVSYSLATNRSKKVVAYLLVQGFTEQKVKAKTINQITKGKNGIEIKITF